MAMGDKRPSLSVGESFCSWVHPFPYQGGDAVVTRLRDGWRVDLDGTAAVAKTIVEAFENALGRNARQDEMVVIVAALAHDQRGH